MSDAATEAVSWSMSWLSLFRRVPGGRRECGETVSFVAALITEPDNPYDKNAVKICVSGSGETIRHLSRADAVAYGEVFKLISSCGRVGACKAKVIGGIKGKPSFGVMIDIRDPDGLLKDLTETIRQSPQG